MVNKTLLENSQMPLIGKSVSLVSVSPKPKVHLSLQAQESLVLKMSLSATQSVLTWQKLSDIALIHF